MGAVLPRRLGSRCHCVTLYWPVGPLLLWSFPPPTQSPCANCFYNTIVIHRYSMRTFLLSYQKTRSNFRPQPSKDFQSCPSMTQPTETTDSQGQYNALLQACTTNDLHSLQTLLDDPSASEVALARPKKTYHLVTIPILNLFDLLAAAARAGNSKTAEHLLKFAHRNNIAYDELINGDIATIAIEGADSLEVFRVFVRAWPQAVNIDMGYVGDPLSYSIAQQQAKLARFLLDNGADPNRRCCAHTGPGHYLRFSVIMSRDLEAMQALLEHGAQVKRSGAVQAAAKLGHLDALELLLEYGADVNERLPAKVGFLSYKNKHQQASETPLHIAVLNGQVDAARWLLAHGPDPSIDDKQGRTPEMIACESGKEDLMKLFSA